MYKATDTFRYVALMGVKLGRKEVDTT